MDITESFHKEITLALSYSQTPGLISYPVINSLYQHCLELPAPAGFEACPVQLAGDGQPGEPLLPVSLDQGRGPAVVLVGGGFIFQQ